MHTWEWVVTAIVLVGALIFTLAWWKIADYWADAEHKRFKGKVGGKTGETVVIKGMGGAGSEVVPGPGAKDGGDRGG